MDRQDQVVAAAIAERNARNMAIDCISIKARQLESLLALIALNARLDELPTDHRENVSWLACDLAACIVDAATTVCGVEPPGVEE
jgi:hypothetical protein